MNIPSYNREVLDTVKEAVFSCTGVKTSIEIKARRRGPYILVAIKTCVSRLATVEEGHSVAEAVEAAGKEVVYNAQEVLVYVNPC